MVQTSRDANLLPQAAAHADSGSRTSAAAAAAVHIRWERQLNRVRLYGPAQKLDLIQAAIETFLQQTHQQTTSKAIPLPERLYRHILMGGREVLSGLQQQAGVHNVNLDMLGRRLCVTGSGEAVAAAEAAALALLATSSPTEGKWGAAAAIQQPSSSRANVSLKAGAQLGPQAGAQLGPPRSEQLRVCGEAVKQPEAQEQHKECPVCR